MWHPAHIDGRTLVIVEPPRTCLGDYTVVESGRLSYTGEELLFVVSGGERSVTEHELASFQPVNAQNRIRACAGFDFFFLRSPASAQTATTKAPPSPRKSR